MTETYILNRYSMGQDCTLGQLLDSDNELYCYTLELPWKDNIPQESCIPEGTYKVIPHNSDAHPGTWEITNVPGRSAILLHTGNTVDDTEGCVIVGSPVGSLNGKPAVLHSFETMETLRGLLPDCFTLEIR